MRRIPILIIILTIAVSACASPIVDEPTAPAEMDSATVESQLAQPTELPAALPEVDMSDTEKPEIDQPTPVPDSESNGDVDAGKPQPVSPVTVDLGKLTPQPPVITGPVEMPRPGVPDPLPRLIELSKANLAERVGLDSAGIEVVIAHAVTWNDSSLGCPRPGMMYAQVLTPGYRVILSADSRQYAYHAADPADFFLCESPDPAGFRQDVTE